MGSGGPVQNTGLEFEDADVARAYLRRPPYPPALHDRLAELAPRPGHLLDLGCGPGKLACALADRFDAVTAIDPSAAMIALAQQIDAGRHPNIRWVCAGAEEAVYGPPTHLAVAGASLHWMRHAVVFPRLCDALAPDAMIATVDGDGPSGAPWLAAYRGFVSRWVERLGFVFDAPEFRARMTAHEAWIDVEGREVFLASHRMRIADLVEAEHSRATWARSKLGPETTRAFDEDLHRLLEPHADGGLISFEVGTRLAWGRPRRTPRT